MTTVSEILSGIQARLVTLASRLANAECKQPKESLVAPCTKVAEQVAEMPDWKKGSAVNERPIASTAQADWDDQHRSTQLTLQERVARVVADHLQYCDTTRTVVRDITASVLAEFVDNVALAFKTCNQQRKRIAELERQLAKEKKDFSALDDQYHRLGEKYEVLQWQPITPESLTEWKKQQLQVEASWNPQEVANTLNLPLGSDIRKEILPNIKVLQEENARLVELVKRLITDTDCHFETPEVIDNLVGSEYLRENVQRGLQVRTTGERWSLYRAIVKIAIAHRMQESDLK